MKDDVLRTATMREKLAKDGPGRFPADIGFHYPYHFVKELYFDRRARDGNLDVHPGGYMAQDPTLEADLLEFGSLIMWAEHEVKKPRFKLPK